MFLDVLDMIFDNFGGVISALNVDLFKLGSVGVSFWELILGMLTVSILFGFFLAPRPGSVLGGISNSNAKENAKLRAEQNSAKKGKV